MITAMSSALGGLHAAGARFEQAAASIARAPAQKAVQSAGEGSPAPGGRPIDSPVTGIDGDGEFVNALIEMKLAAASYEASIAAVKAVERMQDALLDITS